MGRIIPWVLLYEEAVGLRLKLGTLGKQLVLEIYKDDCLGLAAEMAYNFLLALVPALIFLVSILGVIGKQSQALPFIFSTLDRFAPFEAIELLKQTAAAVFEGSSGGLAFMSILGALWAASNGAMVIIKGLNRAYEMPVQEGHYLHPYIHQRGLALLMVVSLTGLFLIGGNLIVFGDFLIEHLRHFLHLMGHQVLLLTVGKWVVVLLVAIASCAFLYGMAMGPRLNRHHWWDALPGAIVFILLWVSVSWLFSAYVENLGKFNQVYGSLGVVVILMIWFYLSSLSLLIGGEMNALLAAPHPHRGGKKRSPLEAGPLHQGEED